MNLRPHRTDTIGSRVCQQSLTEGETSQHGEKSPKLRQTEDMKQEDNAGRTRFQDSSRAKARQLGTTAEVDADSDGVEGSAGDVHACNPSAQEAETGRAV